MTEEILADTLSELNLDRSQGINFLGYFFKDEVKEIPSIHLKKFKYCKATGQVYHADFYSYNQQKKSLVKIDILNNIRNECADQLRKLKKSFSPTYDQYLSTKNDFLEIYDFRKGDTQFESNISQICVESMKSITLMDINPQIISKKDGEFMDNYVRDFGKIPIYDDDIGLPKYYEVLKSAALENLRARRIKTKISERLMNSLNIDKKYGIYIEVCILVHEFISAWHYTIFKETLAKLYPELASYTKSSLSNIDSNMKIILNDNIVNSINNSFNTFGINIELNTLINETMEFVKHQSCGIALISYLEYFSKILGQYQEVIEKFGEKAIEMWIGHYLAQTTKFLFKLINIDTDIIRNQSFNKLIESDFFDFAEETKNMSLTDIMEKLYSGVKSVCNDPSIRITLNPNYNNNITLDKTKRISFYNNYFMDQSRVIAKNVDITTETNPKDDGKSGTIVLVNKQKNHNNNKDKSISKNEIRRMKKFCIRLELGELSDVRMYEKPWKIYKNESYPKDLQDRISSLIEQKKLIPPDENYIY